MVCTRCWERRLPRPDKVDCFHGTVKMWDHNASADNEAPIDRIVQFFILPACISTLQQMIADTFVAAGALPAEREYRRPQWVILCLRRFLYNLEDISDDDIRLGQVDEVTACFCHNDFALRRQSAIGTHELLPKVLHLIGFVS